MSAVLLTLAGSVAAFDCKDIMADRQTFNFKSLGGPHLLHYYEENGFPLVKHNYTFHIDLCDKLGKHNGKCHQGARVCGELEETAVEGNSTVHNIDIAGTYKMYNNRKIDAKFSLLAKSGSNADVGRQGVRAELHGGRFPFDDAKTGRDQMAIIEFVCDPERTGLEGDEKDEGDGLPDNDDDKEKDGDKDKDDDKEKDGDKEEKRWNLGKKEESGSGKCEDSDASLRFCGYNKEDDEKTKVDVLRLEWRTKYACRDAPSDSEGGHWGFFTWFIIILFLAVAAYLIFGSWLNYNRYGARGWDLLPHGDTIRDIPYILKDWARAITNKVQGPGSRGGYSAV
ncbi:hypothetical protein EJ04DRAFT_558801 [Polyplosphaeria fusca]|uniref:Autophagy-related protein 27 n=1 Tax=Polyplosphaeria fusca TaxID=682080 RepID=A0A9P4V8Z9_9PLEO|nr:hypothetical protein EJ04DRAFT_558801 [Polyplosphaeria fusca]